MEHLKFVLTKKNKLKKLNNINQAKLLNEHNKIINILYIKLKKSLRILSIGIESGKYFGEVVEFEMNTSLSWSFNLF